MRERATTLRRSADDADTFERPIVANADQLFIVTALADPPPRVGMIDRILVAAYDARIDPVLCLTKADLARPDALVAAYSPWASPSWSPTPTPTSPPSARPSPATSRCSSATPASASRL